LGMTLAVLLGPALFALVQTSMNYGFKKGVFLAFGIFLSDITLVFLCFIGALQIVSDGKNRVVFGIISGVILIVYGIVTFVHQVKNEKNKNSSHLNGLVKNNWIAFILKGFFLNVANPYVWVFWIGVAVGKTSDYGDNTRSAIFFFSGALLTILFTDIVKAYIAKRIKHILKPSNIKIMNKVVGVMLFFFGVVLIVRTAMTYYKEFA